jgi:hypothetical protein
LSLLRQWSLRPQFWEETPLVAVGPGTPLFSVLDNNKPRAAALIYGAVLSALVLNSVVWTMGYAWNHPIFIELRRPVFVPPASWERKSSAARPGETESTESALYSQEGRVVLIFNWHAGDASAVPDGSSSARPAGSSLPDVSANPSPSALQAYAGTYLSTSEKREQVNITVNGGRLQLEIVGVLSSPLLPGAGSGGLICVVRHCAVTFPSNPEGTVDHVEVKYDGHEIQASRVQGAVF